MGDNAAAAAAATANTALRLAEAAAGERRAGTALAPTAAAPKADAAAPSNAAATARAISNAHNTADDADRAAHGEDDISQSSDSEQNSDDLSHDSRNSPALSEAETLLQLAASTPAKPAIGRKRQHGRSNATSSSRKRQHASAVGIAAAVAAAAEAELTAGDTDEEIYDKAAPAGRTAAKKRTGRKGYTVEELPGGIKKVNMGFCLSSSSSFRIPIIPKELAAACFPKPCTAQLEFIIDEQPAALAEPITVRIARCDNTVHGLPRSSYQMKGAHALCQLYAGYYVTGMSAAASTEVDSSTKRLTLHLRSPAATALAQYAAAAAEAAADRSSTWHTHRLQESERRVVQHNGKDVRMHVPGALIRAAYPGPPQLPFRVQVLLVKDGQRMGSAGLRGSTVTKKRQLNLPAKLLRVMDGCTITRLKAAAPNFLQVHVRSDPDNTDTASDGDAEPVVQDMAAADTWHQHSFEGAAMRHIASDTKEIRQLVPGSLLKAAYGNPELPFKVQLSLHKDGEVLGTGEDHRHGTISNKRQLHIPFKWLRMVMGCTLTHVKAKAPNLLQVHVTSSDAGGGVASAADADGVAAAVVVANAGDKPLAQGQFIALGQSANQVATAPQPTNEAVTAAADVVSSEQQSTVQATRVEAAGAVRAVSDLLQQQAETLVQQQPQQPHHQDMQQETADTSGQQVLLQRMKPARLGQLRGRPRQPHAVGQIAWGNTI